MKLSFVALALAACSSGKADPTPSNAPPPPPAAKPVDKPAAKPPVDTELGAADKLKGYSIALPAGAKVTPDAMSEPGTAVRVEIAPYDLTVKQGAGDFAYVRTEIEKQSHDAPAGVKIRSQSADELVWTMSMGQDVWEFITVVAVGDAKVVCRSTIPRETEADMRAELAACKTIKRVKKD
jgi:hypothetical protein